MNPFDHQQTSPTIAIISLKSPDALTRLRNIDNRHHPGNPPPPPAKTIDGASAFANHILLRCRISWFTLQSTTTGPDGSVARTSSIAANSSREVAV